jgi:hypothetical protein
MMRQTNRYRRCPVAVQFLFSRHLIRRWAGTARGQTHRARRAPGPHAPPTADFELAAFWEHWCARQEESRPSYPVTARVSPNIIPFLPRYFGERIHTAIAQAGPPDAAGWITLTLPFETARAARERILGFGRAVEVLEPEPLRKNIIDYAAQIVAFYNRVANSPVSL